MRCPLLCGVVRRGRNERPRKSLTSFEVGYDGVRRELRIIPPPLTKGAHMLEHHVNSPVTRRRLRSGPAAEHVDGFADWLHRHGYKPASIDSIFRSLAGWTDWMQSAGFTVHDCPAGFGGVHGRTPGRWPCAIPPRPQQPFVDVPPRCSSGFSENTGCCRRLPHQRLQSIFGRSSGSFGHGCVSTAD